MEEVKKEIEENEQELENAELNNEVASYNNEVNNNQKQMKSNKGLIIGLVVIIILLLGALIYFLFFNGDKGEPEPGTKETPAPVVDNTPTPTPELSTPEPENDGNKKNELTVYKAVEDGSLAMEDPNNDWTYPAFTIKVSDKNSKVLAFDTTYSLFVLYKDNDLYLYNVKTKTSQKLGLESNYKDYQLIINEKQDKVIGIGYLRSDNKIGYYNVLTNKKLYDGKYKAYSAAGESYLNIREANDNYIMLRASKATYLLNINTEKEQLSYKYNEEPGGEYEYESYKSNNKYIYVFKSCMTDYCEITNVYDEQFKQIYKGEVSDEIFSFYNGNIYLVEKTKDKFIVKKMDTTGKVISSSEQKDEAHVIINNYVVYEKDKTLYIMNIDDQQENKKLGKPSVDWHIDEYFTGYYSRKDLDAIGETNKKEGIYVVLEYEDSEENTESGIEYCYTKDKQVVEYPTIGGDGRAKPVLYLYPEKETNVTVTFSHPEYLTTTYPKYINSWNVVAKPNGDMKDSDGKYYYALYWDEKRYNEVDFHEGFYVEGKDAINFLEEKLEIIGLNEKERNEFIMYWLPIMEANKKNLVYFELTEERELGNKLIITPKPDSLLRVSIHIKKVNEKVSLKEQKLSTFNRVGFTAIEWGGMTY